MRSAVRWLAVVFLMAVTVLGWPATAHAKDSTPSSWRIPAYDVTAQVDASGTAAVTLVLDFDFARDAGHGPYLTLPLRQEIAGDPDRWRMLDVAIVSVTSPTGADVAQQRTEENGVLLLRIGSEGRTFTGVQRYEIRYTLRGLIAPSQASSGLDEVNWNVVGPGWEVPIDAVTARVTGPAGPDVVRTACFTGTAYDLPCDAHASVGGTATFSHSQLGKNRPLQIVTGFPAGTFVGAEPRYTKRYWVGNLFPLTPATGADTQQRRQDQ